MKRFTFIASAAALAAAPALPIPAAPVVIGESLPFVKVTFGEAVARLGPVARYPLNGAAITKADIDKFHVALLNARIPGAEHLLSEIRSNAG